MAYGRTDALGGAAGDKAGNRGGMDPRLKPAAHDFEASMMQELLKPMEKDPLFSSGNGDGMGLVSGDGSASGWSSLGTESLAKAISEAGGLGMATQVIAEVEAEAKQAQGAGQGAAQGESAGAGRGGPAGRTHGIAPKVGGDSEAGVGRRALP